MERFGAIVGEPTRNKQAGDVSPTEARCRFFDQHHAVFGESVPAVGQLRDDVVEAFASAIAHAAQGRVQFGVIGADEVTEQVNLTPGERGRDFDARDHFDVGGRELGFGDSGERVVIGDGNGREVGLLGERGDLRRPEFAIALGGVNVQIGTPGPSECREPASDRGEG